MAKQVIIKSRRVVTPEGVREAAIIIEDGRISELVSPGSLSDHAVIEDWGDLAILPGLVDPHVHINEPGRTAWEGFETATAAAAAGGITTLVDMPLNSSPVTTTRAALQEKIAASQGKLRVDCGFHAGLVPGNEAQIEALLDAGVLGVKAFLCHSGIDDFPNATERELRAVMGLLAERNVPLLVHAELSGEAPDASGQDPRSYAAYYASRPPAWELRAIELLIGLCREFGTHVHIVHLATGQAVAMLEAARDEGLAISVETCPHYLYFAAEQIPDADTRFKCAPPMRDEANRDALWRALQAGVIDLIASDHSPSTPALKEIESGNLQKAWGGIASLELGISIVWTEAQRRGASLEDLVKWMSLEPARLVHLDHQVGAIAPGRLANLVVFDEAASFVVDGQKLHQRHKITPYDTQRLRGVVQATYLRGQKIYANGQLVGPPSGAICTTRP
ncbi:MAG: allantoinase AllB [Bradymonadaceae bacterium]|nr:allantoinase AllB [Lujinxingiaceae bacterium]